MNSVTVLYMKSRADKT